MDSRDVHNLREFHNNVHGRLLREFQRIVHEETSKLCSNWTKEDKNDQRKVSRYQGIVSAAAVLSAFRLSVSIFDRGSPPGSGFFGSMKRLIEAYKEKGGDPTLDIEALKFYFALCEEDQPTEKLRMLKAAIRKIRNG